ncbi:MAG: lamin tail domain-containing protein, partial [bacterium]|nr:lamin tail domain-containing protein [bacterium]
MRSDQLAKSMIVLSGTLLMVLQLWHALALESAPLVINEIAYRGTTASSSDEWIELYNTTSSPIDLDGWELVINGSSFIQLSGTIAPFDYYLLERTDDTTVADISADLIYTGALADGGASLRLQKNGELIDQVSQLYVNLSSPPTDFSGRSSMERINPLLGGDVAYNWRINDQQTINGSDASGSPIFATPRARNSHTVAALGALYYGGLVASNPPSAPLNLSAQQLDHRLHLSWDSPAPYAFFQLFDGIQSVDLGEATSYLIQPAASGTASFEVRSFDLFLQQSEPALISVDYVLPLPPQLGQVLINELETLPASGGREWIELFNSSASWLDLGSCTLHDAGAQIFSFQPTDAIAPAGFFVAELSSQKLNNGGDLVELRCAAMLIDQIRYGISSLAPEDLQLSGYEQSAGYLPDPNGENTLGRSPDGSGLWFLISRQDYPSRGSANPDLRPVSGVSDPRFVMRGDEVRVSWTNPDPEHVAGVMVFLRHSGTDSEFSEAGTVESPDSSLLLENLPQELIEVKLVTFNASGRQAEGSDVFLDFISLAGLEISEVLPNPKTGELEFIELYNNSDHYLDLSDFELDVTNASADENDPSGSFIFSDFGLFPGEYFPLSIDPDFYGFRLSNIASQITLFDPDGFPAASLDYLSPPRGISVTHDDQLLGTLIHPTPGAENIFANAAPTAVITVQGGGKTSGCHSLSFNPTAANSSDPDGDELNYQWFYHDKQGLVLHAELVENPLSFSFTEAMGDAFTIRLVVSDFFGASDDVQIQLQLGDCASRRPTEAGAGSSDLAPPTLPAQFSTALLINEILPDPAGKDSGNEYVELFNSGSAVVRLDGWKLGGKTKKKLDGLQVPGQGYLVFRGVVLRNGGDIIELLDPAGATLSSVSYPQALEGRAWSRGEDSSFLWLKPSPAAKNPKPSQVVHESDSVQVVRVIDGDTIDVRLEGKVERVRLIGVDTPETVHPFKPLERFGKEASNYSKSQLDGQTVRLEYDLTPRDKYGRLLAYVHLGNRHFNAELIAKGYAFAYLRFPFRYFDQFHQLQVQAEQSKLGMWAEEAIVQELYRLQQEVVDEEAEAMEILQEFVEEEAEEEQKEDKNSEEPLREYNQLGWQSIFLNEVLPNPKGKDGEAGEWFELVNEADVPVDLSGWRLVNDKQKEIFVFSQPHFLASRSVSPPFSPSLAIKNTSDTLRLLDPLGTVRDQLSYSQSIKDDQVWARDPLTRSWILSSTATPGWENQVTLVAFNSSKKAPSGKAKTKAQPKPKKLKPLYILQARAQEHYQAVVMGWNQEEGVIVLDSGQHFKLPQRHRWMLASFLGSEQPVVYTLADQSTIKDFAFASSFARQGSAEGKVAEPLLLLAIVSALLMA